MKRAALILLIVIAAAGCGGDDKSGNNTGTGTGPEYSLVFNRAAVDEYELVFTASAWQSLQDEPREYVSAALKFGNETYTNVGVRYKGNSSFDCVPPPKKPFKVDFDRYVDDQDFHGVKKLNFSNSLWDPSMMREMLGYDTFSNAGCPAGRTSHVKLFITAPGAYDHEYIGVYVMIEQVDKVYLDDRFGNSGGNLYKATMWGADLRWHGSEPEPYRECYLKKTNKSADDWSDLIRLLDVLNNTPDNAFKAEIGKVFNVDGFLAYLAANTALSSLDSIAGRNCNFYLYNNSETNRFEFLPWDLNEVFGNHTLPRDNGLTADEMLTLDVHNPVSHNRPASGYILIERILRVSEYKSAYLSRLRTLVEGKFSPASMHAEIDRVYNLIKADVYLDVYKEFPSDDFDRSISKDIPDNSDPERILGLKPFVTQRVSNILAQLGR
jgi:spore coat protein CotH